MSKTKYQTTYSGAPIFWILGIVFVILKLCGVIDWSWVWVTCPFWAGIALSLLVLFGAFIFASLAGILAAILGGLWLVVSRPRNRRR